MIWIKVCGITRLEDALTAAGAGADALGFVFAPSPRQVSAQQAKEITSRLPRGFSLEAVGVFVDAPADDILRAAEAAGLTTVQLHGSEDPDFCSRLSLPVIKAFRVRDAESLEALSAYRGAVKAMLLDTFVPKQAGGTGRRFDLSLAVQARHLGSIIIAGGLGADNVAEVIATARPFGVDASSRLESAPGIKDAGLVRGYITNARKADATT
ncbi:MAG: phosphoribosylanthranilate isomerase [Pseudomonadota bacterium]